MKTITPHIIYFGWFSIKQAPRNVSMNIVICAKPEMANTEKSSFFFLFITSALPQRIQICSLFSAQVNNITVTDECCFDLCPSCQWYTATALMKDNIINWYYVHAQ